MFISYQETHTAILCSLNIKLMHAAVSFPSFFQKDNFSSFLFQQISPLPWRNSLWFSKRNFEQPGKWLSIKQTCRTFEYTLMILCTECCLYCESFKYLKIQTVFCIYLSPRYFPHSKCEVTMCWNLHQMHSNTIWSISSPLLQLLYWLTF